MSERRKRAIELLSQIDFCPVYFLDAVDATAYELKDFHDIGIHEYGGWKIHHDLCDIKKTDFTGGLVNFQYWQRPVTMGEIGCTVSHYLVWKHAYEMNYQSVLIFEDDIDFKLNELVSGLNICSEFIKNNKCDIFYLACIPWLDDGEVDENIVKCEYAYQLHSYVVVRSAMKILLDAGLFDNLIVSDEFVPALYGNHPRKDIRRLYNANRKLLAYRLRKKVVIQTDQIFGDSQTSTNIEEKLGL